MKKRTDCLRREVRVDDDVARLLAVDAGHPVLKGVNELILMLEEMLLEDAGNTGADVQVRLGAMSGFGALEVLRDNLEKWREAGMKAASNTGENGG